MKKYLAALIGPISKMAPWPMAQIAFYYFASPVRIPRPESERLWYEQAKKYSLKSGCAAFEWGKDSNPLVLLIHGWNGRGTQIASFALPLVEKGFRVVALDGPGHGESPGSMTNPSHFAHFIEESQKELAPDGAHAVISHSFGGGCSVLAASRSLKVKKLVLIASPAFYDRVVQFFAQSIKLSPKAEKYFFEKIAKISGIPPVELNVAKMGSHLKIHKMIVHDVDDNAVNFLSAKAMNEAWPGSTLLKTEGLGHRRILRDKKVIEAVCNFIAT